MSPVSDLMVSTSLDGTARVWDMNIPKCQGRINLSQHPAAAFDPTGAVLAVVCDTPPETLPIPGTPLGMDVCLYDIRVFEKGPFAYQSLALSSYIPDAFSSQPPYSCVSVQFSNDGNKILVSTGSDSLFVVDGFLKPEVPVRRLHGPQKECRMTALVQPSFSPDDRFVIAGTDSGALAVWDIAGSESSLLRPSVIEAHPLSVNVVSYNPKFDMLASACTAVSFWLPQTPPSSQPQ